MSLPAVQRAPHHSGRRRRYLRLSLRTLLLLIVLLGVWLGLTFNRVRQQRAAVARIEQLGGSVQYLHEVDPDRGAVRDSVLPGPPWLRRLLGKELFETVVSVNLDQTAVTDADLRVIGRLRGVVHVQLDSTGVSDAGLYEIRHWSKLRGLGLVETRVTGAGLRHLAGMPDLTDLALDTTATNDEGLAYLRGHERMARLSLGHTHITPEGVEHLRSCQALVSLSLRSTPIDDSALPALLSLPKLDSLDVTHTNISGRGLLELCRAWPESTVLGYLVKLCGDADKKFNRVSNFWVQWLDLARAVDGEDRLKFLDFSWSNIQDEHLAALHGLENVELIDLRGSDVTPQGVDALRKALPRCEVRY